MGCHGTPSARLEKNWEMGYQWIPFSSSNLDTWTSQQYMVLTMRGQMAVRHCGNGGPKTRCIRMRALEFSEFLLFNKVFTLMCIGKYVYIDVINIVHHENHYTNTARQWLVWLRLFQVGIHTQLLPTNLTVIWAISNKKGKLYPSSVTVLIDGSIELVKTGDWSSQYENGWAVSAIAFV